MSMSDARDRHLHSFSSVWGWKVWQFQKADLSFSHGEYTDSNLNRLVLFIVPT